MTSGNDAQKIIDAVKTVTGVTELEILSRRRDENLYVARYIAIQLMLDMTDMSQSEIARLLNRDHSTITYVKKKMQKRGRGATALNTKLAQARRMLAS
jgi:chromosomal replication initiator protein